MSGGLDDLGLLDLVDCQQLWLPGIGCLYITAANLCPFEQEETRLSVCCPAAAAGPGPRSRSGKPATTSKEFITLGPLRSDLREGLEFRSDVVGAVASWR